jgi:hypothetical protein
MRYRNPDIERIRIQLLVVSNLIEALKLRRRLFPPLNPLTLFFISRCMLTPRSTTRTSRPYHTQLLSAICDRTTPCP